MAAKTIARSRRAGAQDTRAGHTPGRTARAGQVPADTRAGVTLRAGRVRAGRPGGALSTTGRPANPAEKIALPAIGPAAGPQTGQQRVVLFAEGRLAEVVESAKNGAVHRDLGHGRASRRVSSAERGRVDLGRHIPVGDAERKVVTDSTCRKSTPPPPPPPTASSSRAGRSPRPAPIWAPQWRELADLARRPARKARRPARCAWMWSGWP